MLVDFNTAIKEIREANLDMIELINKWKELLSTTPANVAFTFADGSSVSFPNVAKLLAEYGSFPYNELEFRTNDNDQGSSYHFSKVEPTAIQLYRYAVGQPGVTKYIKMLNDGTDLCLDIYRYSGGTTSRTKVEANKISLSYTTSASELTNTNINFSRNSNKVTSSLNADSLGFSDTSENGITKSAEFNSSKVYFDEINEIDNRNYRLNITKDEFFYGQIYSGPEGGRAGLRILRDTENNRYLFSFNDSTAIGGAYIHSDNNSFSAGGGYQQSSWSMRADSDGKFKAGRADRGYMEFIAGSLTISKADNGQQGGSYEIRIDGDGIYKDDELVVPFGS